MSFTYRKDVLDSGVTVVSESSRSSNSLAMGFWVGVGSSCEPRSLGGVSHFIEHILFKGTHRRSAYQIAHALESVGGSIDAFAGRETTAFVSRSLPEHLPTAVDVLGDMLCHPAMEDDAIELEKRVIIEEIRNYEDTPEEIVHELLARSVWNSSAMGNPILGTVDSVSGFTRKSVFPYFQRHYVSPSTIVAACGKVNHRELVGQVERTLKIPSNKPEIFAEAYAGGIPRVHHERRKVAQCYICMGVEAPPYLDKKRYPTIFLSMIIGGGMTSRLFQEVREKQGLAYSVYCSCEFYRKTGVFLVFLAVDPKKARKAVRMVSKELKRLKEDGLRRGELASAKEQLKGNLILGLESTSARMGRLARQEFYLGEYQPMEKSIGMAMAVKSSMVRKQAENLLDSSKFSLVVVGPDSTDFPTARDMNF
jgi:predicted Zn-dependent peptidase